MSLEEDDAENALVAELRALAGAGASASDDGSFEVRRGKHVITVVHHRGSSSSLMLRAVYDAVARADHPALVSSEGAYREAPSRDSLRAPRPLKILLHPETAADARAEHQTGDAVFDHAVFIETPTTNDAVLRAVLGPEVRAAVLALFELGFLRVSLDDAVLDELPGQVEAYLWTFASSEPPIARASASLDAFARILDHLPAIVSSREKHAPALSAPGWIRALGWVGVLGVLVGYPATSFLAKAAQCIDVSDGASMREECASRFAIALLVAPIVGIIASFVVRPSLLRRFGERSGSFIPIALARLKVLLGSAVLTFLALVFALLVALRS